MRAPLVQVAICASAMHTNLQPAEVGSSGFPIRAATVQSSLTFPRESCSSALAANLPDRSTCKGAEMATVSSAVTAQVAGVVCTRGRRGGGTRCASERCLPLQALDCYNSAIQWLYQATCNFSESNYSAVQCNRRKKLGAIDLDPN